MYLVPFGIEIYLGSRFTDLYKKEPVIRISTDDDESSPCKYIVFKKGLQHTFHYVYANFDFISVA